MIMREEGELHDKDGEYAVVDHYVLLACSYRKGIL